MGSVIFMGVFLGPDWLGGRTNTGNSAKIVKIGQKIQKISSQKKKNLTTIFFFFFFFLVSLELKLTFLGVKLFCQLGMGGAICLVKKKKKKKKKTKNFKKRKKNVNFFQIFKGKFFPPC